MQTAPQAPPVGSYDVKNRKQGLAPGFGKGKRFAELKGECNRVNFACHLGQLLPVMCHWPLRTANQCLYGNPMAKNLFQN